MGVVGIIKRGEKCPDHSLQGISTNIRGTGEELAEGNEEGGFCACS